MKASKIFETCLYVDDLEAAKKFYADVLGLEFYAEVEGRHVFFRCGDAMFLLFNPEATKDVTIEGIGAHGAHGEGHAAFHMREDELDQWRAQLEAKGVEIESDLTWPNGGRSLYFRDPSGNSVELVTPKVWELPE